MQELTNPIEEEVSDFLDLKRLLISNRGHVSVLEPLGLDLQGIGIRIPLPEPTGRPELNELGGDVRNALEQLAKLVPWNTVLDAQSNVGNPVFHRSSTLFRESLDTVRIRLPGVNEMPMAALKSEAVGEYAEGVDHASDWSINRIQIERRQGAVAILPVRWVRHEEPG
ncbi:MAG: hypothetical protein ACYC6T_02395 [Thermoleophilia bacterium]